MNVKRKSSGAPGAARRRTQAERSEATRAALIATARSLFAARGYAGVGTEELVRASGVTRGALYHHFEGKADLFGAVFEDVERELAAKLGAEALSKPDPWEGLVAALGMFLDVCTEPEVQRIALLDAPSVLGWEAWREVEARYGLGLIKLALQNLIDAGIVERQPVDPLAHAILGTLAEAGLYVARADDVEAARAEMGAVLRRMLEGLRSP
ncbi:MAG: TetR family transcriptional regulator [Actinobacteria bacterium 13_1_20CM_3_68_9]|jgi:AcrR family transcriptional regulator|nr:MAG: TetR family transcriptional regulator [Actinobacteria bacterium 13_1_20CM_3_68_9]